MLLISNFLKRRRLLSLPNKIKMWHLAAINRVEAPVSHDPASAPEKGEQIYQRAIGALNNAVAAFNGAQGVTQELRQTQNALSDFQASVTAQELAYNDQLIELYGTPYPDDMGPGKTYAQGYTGPDTIHYTYVENPDTNTYGGILPDPTQAQTFYLDIQSLPADWSGACRRCAAPPAG